MANTISRRKFLTLSGIATLSTRPVVHSLQKIFIGEQLLIESPPDIIFSYVRAKDLLYMQISCYDCKGTDIDRLSAGPKAYIKVSLPHAHITEETFSTEEFGADPKKPAEAFLSDPSIFVFKVKRGLLDLKTALIEWEKNTPLQLVGIDKPSSNYTIPGSALFPSANTVMETVNNNAAVKNSEYPKTTIEAPVGIYLSPYANEGIGQIKFQFPNKIITNKYKDGGTNLVISEGAKRDIKREQLVVVYVSKPGKSPGIDPANPDVINPADVYESYELWSNDLVGADGKPPKMKVAGTSPFKVNRKNQIPNSFDKDDLGRQFKKNPNDFIEIYSPFLKFTALGLYTKLSYASTNLNDVLQKWRQEMVLGRDEYIEIERLGYHHPLGLRMAEVTIGRRVIDETTGISYINREYHIKPIDPELVYRLPEDQAESAEASPGALPSSQQLKDSVLVPDADPLKNKINQIKRTLPFQKIIVNTVISPPIRDVHSEVDKILQTKPAEYGQITGQVAKICDQTIPGYLNNLQQFFAALKAKSDALNAKDTNKYWPGVPDWIKNLILGGELKPADLDNFLKQVKSGGQLDNYLNYQRYLGDFSRFLSDLAKGEFPWAFDDSVKTAADKISGNIKQLTTQLNQITGNINKLYQIALNYTPEDFREQFSALFAADGISADETYARIQNRIKNSPNDLRRQFQLEAEAAFNDYYNKIKGLPDEAAKKARFEQELKSYREKMNKVAALASEALDNPLETVLGFWPQAKDGSEIVFEFTGIDWDGNKVKLEAPILFIRHEAVVQAQKLVDKANHDLVELKNKYNNVIGNLYDAEDYLRTEGKRINDEINKINGLTKDPNSTVALLQAELKAVAPEQFQDIKQLYDRVHSLDDQIKANYQNISNQVLRQLQVNNQKVAYYKRLADQDINDAKKQVTALETEFVEFTACGLAEIAMINANIQKNAQEKLHQFSDRFRNAFPQLEAAKAALPVIKDLANFDKGTLIKYGEAYKSAGVEILTKAQNDPNYAAIKQLYEKGKVNSEKILFEVQKQGDQFAGVLDEKKRALENDFDRRLRQLNALKNAGAGAIDQYKAQVKDWATGMQAQSNNWLANQRNYADHQIDNLFAGAGQQLAGTAIPGTVVNAISLYDNAYASVKGDVDHYTGAVTSYVKDREAEVKEYTKEAQGQLKNMLKDLKIFGISLVDYLIKDVKAGFDKLPKQNIQEVKDAVTNVIKTKELTYRWDIKLNEMFTTTGLLRNGNGFNGSPDATLSCALDMLIPQSPGQPMHVNSVISINNFGIAIPLSGQDLIAIYFSSVNFVKTSTATFGNVTTSSHTDVQISKVDFKYLLELIKKLEEMIGLDNAFVPTITSEGISMEIGVNLPAMSIGAFSMINAAIFAGVTLPFAAGRKPRVDFAFSERENPFTIAAGIFGGRGFIGLGADSDGMQRFEASLEFGGYLGLNFGIAKGQAYLMAGIYFRWQRNDAVFIEGYVVCGGNLNLLGIIQVSVVFFLGMNYQGGSLNGRASVTVSIHMLFFSASYTLSFEKHISGSNSNLQDNTINYRRDQTQWAYDDDTRKNHDYLIEDALNAAPALQAPYYIKDGSGKGKPVSIFDPGMIFSHQLSPGTAGKISDAKKYSQLFSL